MALTFGNAIVTNGSSQYARSGAGVASSATDNFSMTLWVYVLAYPGAGWATVFQNGANDARGMSLQFGTTGAYRADYAFVAAVNSGATLSLNTWYHIGVVRNAGTSQAYVNGSASGSTIGNAPNSGSDYVVVGAGSDSGGTANNFANTRIDDVRFYERAISAAEMTSLYNNGNVWPYTDISSTSLKYWYKLDESSGNPQDSSGNAIHLTNTGTATFTTGIVATGSTSTTNSNFFSFFN